MRTSNSTFSFLISLFFQFVGTNQKKESFLAYMTRYSLFFLKILLLFLLEILLIQTNPFVFCADHDPSPPNDALQQNVTSRHNLPEMRENLADPIEHRNFWVSSPEYLRGYYTRQEFEQLDSGDDWIIYAECSILPFDPSHTPENPVEMTRSMDARETSQTSLEQNPELNLVRSHSIQDSMCNCFSWFAFLRWD